MLVGVDWGGTKIEAMAIGDNGQSITRLREMTPRSDYEGCLATIASLVSRVEEEAGETGSIGVGIPGSVDPRTGIAKGASSTWLNGKSVEDDLRRTLKREVRIANDADCFAVSEAVDGAGAGHHVVFAVILGSGAGAGIAVAGKAHHGPNNGAGEWGHNPLPRADVTEIPGPACYCEQVPLSGALGLRLVVCPRLPRACQHRFGAVAAAGSCRDHRAHEAW
jgi:fructokinase